MEKNLPDGRYLQGHEICKIFKLQPASIPESETDEMNKLLWMWREKSRIEFDTVVAEKGFDGVDIFPTFLDELDDWLAYADEHYQDQRYMAPAVVSMLVVGVFVAVTLVRG